MDTSPMQRILTKMFIDDNPTVITLTPTEKTKQPGGGFKLTQGAAREPQTFKLVYQGAGMDGLVVGSDNYTHRFDFVIIGEYDAEIAVNDSWIDENNQKYVIQGLLPHNGYEVRATVKSYGATP